MYNAEPVPPAGTQGTGGVMHMDKTWQAKEQQRWATVLEEQLSCVPGFKALLKEAKDTSTTE